MIRRALAALAGAILVTTIGVSAPPESSGSSSAGTPMTSLPSHRHRPALLPRHPPNSFLFFGRFTYGGAPCGYLPVLPPLFYAPPVVYSESFFVTTPIVDRWSSPYWTAAAPAPEPLPRPAPDRPVRRRPKPPDEWERKAAMQRHLEAGNRAFAKGDYAQALKQYQRAVSAAPLQAAGYFHAAQAYIALGKFIEAGVTIRRGLRLHPRWPNAPFDPRALYRQFPGDYEKHLARLSQAVEENLNDESLLFLLGYQLWFDNRRDEALVLLRRAAALAMDTGDIDRFLAVAKKPQANGQ